MSDTTPVPPDPELPEIPPTPPAGDYAPPAAPASPAAPTPPAAPGGGDYAAAAPPPPPPGAYPPAAPAQGQSPGALDYGQAVSWSWAKFTANVGPLIIGLLAYVGLFIVAFFLWFLIQGAILDTSINSNGTISSPGFFMTIFVGAVGVALFVFLGYLIQAGMVRVGLDIGRGEPAVVGRFFSTDRLAKVVIAGILVAIATFIGTLLCYLPGLIVGFLCQYFVFFIMDKDLEPIDSIKASVQFVLANVLPLLLVYIICGAIVFLGAILCGVGLLVAIPVAVLIQVFAYKSLQGDAVAA